MKYRKKPVVIEAFQLTQEIYDLMWKAGFDLADSDVVQEFPDWLRVACQKGSLKPGCVYVIRNPQRPSGHDGVYIATLESNRHEVKPTDWIIKGVKGELYACRTDIFKLTYEKVE